MQSYRNCIGVVRNQIVTERAERVEAQTQGRHLVCQPRVLFGVATRARHRPARMMRLLSLASLLAGTAFLSACAKRETPVATGTRTQTLHLGNAAEPRDLDPHIITAIADLNIVNQLMEGLTATDPVDARPVAGVAVSWDTSRDGLTWTFHLRTDARWSNGDPVTANDFVTGFRRALSPALGAEYASLLHCLKNAEAFNRGKLADFGAVGARAANDHTLVLTLRNPTPYLASLATMPVWYPVHRATVEKYGRLDTRATAWTRPGNYVGNGPFVLAEWKPNQVIRIAKSRTYWDRASVHLQGAAFYPMASVAEETAFRGGQLHVTSRYLPLAKVAAYRAAGRSALLHEGTEYATTYLQLNCTRAPFNDVRVRQALSLAIDRRELAQKVLQGDLAASSFTPDGAGYAAGTSLPTDVARANALLAAAGFPNGGGFPPVEILFSTHIDSDRLSLEAIQQMWWKALHIDVSLRGMENKVLLDELQHRHYTVALTGWTGDYLDPTTFLDLLHSTNGNNKTGWANPAYDGLLAEAAATLDPARRFALLQKAESVLIDEQPVIPVNYLAQRELRQPAVQGWHTNVLARHPLKAVWLEAKK